MSTPVVVITHVMANMPSSGWWSFDDVTLGAIQALLLARDFKNLGIDGQLVEDPERAAHHLQIINIEKQDTLYFYIPPEKAVEAVATLQKILGLPDLVSVVVPLSRLVEAYS